MIRDAYLIDYAQPANVSHRLYYGLRAWWMVLPQRRGGFVFRDLTPRQFNGSMLNMSQSAWVDGNRPGGAGALTFDNTDDRVRINAAIVSAPPLTLSIWCRSSGGTLLCICSSISNDDWFRITHLGSVFGLDQNSNSGFGFTNINGGSPVAGQWHHVCGVWASGSSRILYADGVQIASSSTTPSPVMSLNRTAIGALDRASAGFCAGDLDDARVYNRALTAGEVRQLYRESLAGYPNLLRRRSDAAFRVATGLRYPRLERGIRGLNRGLCMGLRG